MCPRQPSRNYNQHLMISARLLTTFCNRHSVQRYARGLQHPPAIGLRLCCCCQWVVNYLWIPLSEGAFYTYMCKKKQPFGNIYPLKKNILKQQTTAFRKPSAAPLHIQNFLPYHFTLPSSRDQLTS
jgi:hypothetical protein